MLFLCVDLGMFLHLNQCPLRQICISSQLHLIFSKHESIVKMGKQLDVPNAGLRQTDQHD